jgi:hypothetical protein
MLLSSRPRRAGDRHCLPNAHGTQLRHLRVDGDVDGSHSGMLQAEEAEGVAQGSHSLHLPHGLTVVSHLAEVVVMGPEALVLPEPHTHHRSTT